MKIKCERVEQITVILENRPGILADLCAYLSDRKIDVKAIATVDDDDIGSARLVVDRPEWAKQVLSDAGVDYRCEHCLALEIPSNPGGLAGIARTLSLAGINIDFIYASSLPGCGTALGIFGVSDLERAMTLEWNALP